MPAPGLVFAVAVIAGASTHATGPISLAPEAWDIRFSLGLPEHPYAEGSGWAFDFPTGTNCPVRTGCPGVHYLTTPYTAPIPVGTILTLAFRIEAAPGTVFNFRLEADNTCDNPATVRALLQRAADDLIGVDNRFWSNPVAVALAAGDYTIRVTLSPEQWTNVEGKRSERGFATTLQNIGNIGVTFGGGCFFGHGVNVSAGPARFIMKSASLTEPLVEE